MNDEKIRLINLKLLIDKAFNLLVSEDMRVIIMRFIKGLTFQEMADELDVSIRQVFRLYDTAITSFTTQLEYLKFPQEKIAAEFGDLMIYKETCFILSNEYGVMD